MITRELNSRDSGIAYILNYVVMIVAQIPLVIVMSITESFDNILWISMIATQLGIFFVTFIFIKSRGVNPIEISGIKHKLSGKQYAMLPVITVILLLSSAPIAMLFSMLIRSLGYSTPDISPDTSGNKIFLYIIVIAVLPAICEEFLFRNAILRGMKKKGYLFAAVVSSVMFSLMHGNADQLIHQFFVGMVLAYVMHISGSLLAPIIIHFTNNLIAIGLNYVFESDVLAGVSDGAFAIALVIMIIFGSVLVIMSLKYFAKLELEKRLGKEIIDVNPDNIVVQYLKTAKSMIRVLFSSSGRYEFKENYNSLMKELDYDKEEELVEENTQFDLMKMIMRNRDNLNAVKVGIALAAIIVGLSFLTGFAA